jgi:cysteine synthase A
MVPESILDLIGNTPTLKVGDIYAKLEFLNPSGSLKDRMAHYMVKKAEEKGVLKPGMEIIEVTTGNTGIAFSLISTIKGYKFTAVMPEHMSIERRGIMKSFGAELILTPKEEDVAGAIDRFNQIKKENPQAWYPMQFENPDNIESHFLTTGPEIIQQVGNVDVFVAGVGTGGSLMGVGKALKKVNPDVKLIAVEPAESAVMSGGLPGQHGIQGIGEGFIPPLIDMKMVDEVVKIKTDDAIKMAKELCRKYGTSVGISSGANYLAAQKFSDGKNKVVTLFCDNGNRYISIYNKPE